MQLTDQTRLSVIHDRHIRRKTFQMQNSAIGKSDCPYDSVNLFFTYQMSYKGAAMKAFSAHMPVFCSVQ
jgi:hypothetical protein